MSGDLRNALMRVDAEQCVMRKHKHGAILPAVSYNLQRPFRDVDDPGLLPV